MIGPQKFRFLIIPIGDFTVQHDNCMESNYVSWEMSIFYSLSMIELQFLSFLIKADDLSFHFYMNGMQVEIKIVVEKLYGGKF